MAFSTVNSRPRRKKLERYVHPQLLAGFFQCFFFSNLGEILPKNFLWVNIFPGLWTEGKIFPSLHLVVQKGKAVFVM